MDEFFENLVETIFNPTGCSSCSAKMFITICTTILVITYAFSIINQITPEQAGVGLVMKRDVIVGFTNNSSAKKVGLRKNDRIIAINNEELEKLGYVSNSEMIDRLTGEKNSNVEIAVIRNNETIEYTVTRTHKIIDWRGFARYSERNKYKT